MSGTPLFSRVAATVQSTTLWKAAGLSHTQKIKGTQFDILSGGCQCQNPWFGCEARFFGHLEECVTQTTAESDTDSEKCGYMHS